MDTYLSRKHNISSLSTSYLYSITVHCLYILKKNTSQFLVTTPGSIRAMFTKFVSIVELKSVRDACRSMESRKGEETANED